MTDSPVLDTFLDEVVRELDAGELDLDLASALGLLPEEAPPDGALRDRLRASTRSQHRFEDFEIALCDLFDLPVESVRRLLLAVDTPTREQGGDWDRGPNDGVKLLHLEGGPRVRDAIAGFVRIQPGAVFPHHGHVGTEKAVLIQGSLRDSRGMVFHRGDRVESPPGTEHELVALEPIPVIFAVIVHQGIRVRGEVYGPGDPRA